MAQIQPPTIEAQPVESYGLSPLHDSDRSLGAFRLTLNGESFILSTDQAQHILSHLLQHATVSLRPRD